MFLLASMETNLENASLTYKIVPKACSKCCSCANLNVHSLISLNQWYYERHYSQEAARQKTIFAKHFE